MQWKSLSFVWTALAAIALAVVARADVVETKDGGRLTGKITKVDGTTVTLVTEYAGTLAIKQRQVTGLRTDAPVFVRLKDGTVLSGTDGGAATPVGEITGIWAAGETDPAVIALRRKWSYEAAADITGKSGNKEQFGSALSFRAFQTGPHDKLKLYSAYNRQETDGAVSADQFKAGVDYSDNYSGRHSWYVRDEGGYDYVKDISSYNTAAAGLGYDFIQRPLHLLTGRAGLAFRYEDYQNPATGDVRDAALDFGVRHEYTFKKSKLINNLSYTPSINDFSDFHFEHESYCEIPLFDPKWKLRLGLSNDYNSKPGTGVERLDTTYFTRLVLSWE
ncbi:MAG: DUF481 domain-containing protein [Opitutaceae bacterium]|jgi:putative salt-induced outer membrane protein YdiY